MYAHHVFHDNLCDVCIIYECKLEIIHGFLHRKCYQPLRFCPMTMMLNIVDDIKKNMFFEILCKSCFTFDKTAQKNFCLQ